MCVHIAVLLACVYLSSDAAEVKIKTSLDLLLRFRFCSAETMATCRAATLVRPMQSSDLQSTEA